MGAKKIIRVRPGLTGIGSLVFRDEESIIARALEEGRDLRSFVREDIMPVKGEFESWYVDQASLWTDSKILFATALVLCHPGKRGLCLSDTF